MYDEDEYEDEEGEIGVDEATAAYAKKGTDDRAFVDQQAKDYDEMKRKKRAAIDSLKKDRLTAQSKFSSKQRELNTLEIALRQDHYVETRERVKDERDEAMREEKATREERADIEVEQIARAGDRNEREEKHKVLLEECAALKAVVDETARQISLLEHELLRS